MFSCGKGSDVSITGNETIGGETVDKILSEATKLKRKCKSLRNILLETETKRQEEKDSYDKSLALIKGDFETRLSNLQSQYYIEVRCFQTPKLAISSAKPTSVIFFSDSPDAGV